ncbi:DegT/DnrJ/EryC1/StrS family aminotransferase [Halorhodospira sp. 9621]|uniref:DegT/DnrJ/EryC1/StrS family aminotransferase n=1 Tax=Halorhodospira sp. 9621 TaxID=2899135 RepID=UPI001EE8D5C2|nr:DegT/DnrJ/EryC1/StrS family aminotransferase [Halorhodospira sp. 9621]
MPPLSTKSKATAEDAIPFSRPDLGEPEEAAVLRCLRSGWLTTGPETAELERRFAEAVGVHHAVAVSSCTAAMHLALEGLGVGPGDRVITSVLTFTATAEAIRLCGAEPLLVDVAPETLDLDVTEVERHLSADPRIRAILPVHYAGQACRMDQLLELASRYDVRIVEDAAHAFPARFQGRCVGSLGDATAFSLYANKPLTTGEGGLLTTNNEALAQWARRARLHGIERTASTEQGQTRWRYEVTDAGYKYNLPDLAAALARPQLERAAQARARREAIADYYSKQLAGLPLSLPAVRDSASDHSWHLFPVQLDLEALNLSRDGFIDALAERGIGASVHFIPLHRHRYWRESLGLRTEDFPVAEAAGQRLVSLPIYPGLTDAQVERVADTVATLSRAHRR